MKIGILTFHRAHNYGALLQTYGLQEYFKKLGCEVYIIDYYPDYLKNVYRKSSIKYWFSKNPIRTIKKFFSELFLFTKRKQRWNNFESFINSKFKLYHYNTKELSKFDLIVCGSDQIWNPKITGGRFDETYFGAGISCPVISYSASMGSLQLSDDQMSLMRKLIQGMNAVGVREQSLFDMLSEFVTKPLYVTIDPTLLAGKQIFDKLCNVSRYMKPYVFVYEITEHKETREVAKSIAKQLNAEIVEFVAFLSINRLCSKKVTASPEEFVEYIKKAECIITTSFHGTAFSIMYEKPFYTLRQNNHSDLRSESLLNKLDLNERFIEMSENPIFTPIDYTIVNEKLSLEVELSCNYIKSCIYDSQNIDNSTCL